MRGRDDLADRIDDRVDRMFERGLVAETAELLKKGLAANQTAMQAIGYRQVVEHLQGLRNLAATIQLVKIRTRQFAKRQLTWYQRQLPFSTVNLEPGENPEHVAGVLSDRLTNQV
jgi:tRNA dimethylallyltransferase